jgi:hypothetical protein
LHAAQTAINPCDGHPDDPYQDIGGTHDAFRDNSTAGDLTRLCYSTESTTPMSVDQRCVVTTTTYDASCDIFEQDCEEFAISTSFSDVRVEDYVFGWQAASTANRRIEWVQYVDDPEYVDQSFPNEDLCDPESTCWSVSPGSGAMTAQAITASPTGGKTVGYVSRYNVPSSDQVLDGTVRATSTRTGSQKLGLGMRCTVSAGSIEQGYIAIVNETTNAS